MNHVDRLPRAQKARIASLTSKIADFVHEGTAHLTADDAVEPDGAGYASLVVDRVLQDLANYRAALQRWHAALRDGGFLAVVVPHSFLYDRQLILPSRRNPSAKRLYTPESLLLEVEEALAPNSYRVRLLCDLDDPRDYSDAELDDERAEDIVLVLEKTEVPGWQLDTVGVDEEEPGPLPSFEPSFTRIERASVVPRNRILVLKLDHLGDFIMSIPALEKARARFADAHITLVVGPWNEAMANALGLADEVIAFDAFPRNSSEEKVDLDARIPAFREKVRGEFDLAVDLRSDPDTRRYLLEVHAAVRAGIGTYVQFPFLDIFLPIDITRHEYETARRERISHHGFHCRDFCDKSHYRIAARREKVPLDDGAALIWGPYVRLRPGRYAFEPLVEFDKGLDQDADDGLMLLDIAINQTRVEAILAPSDRPLRIAFEVREPDSTFEFRIYTVGSAPPLGFEFYGGELLREGASSVLHQSEYLSLLIELIGMRMDRYGLLGTMALS